MVKSKLCPSSGTSAWRQLSLIHEWCHKALKFFFTPLEIQIISKVIINKNLLQNYRKF